jgi:hypothetical protein
MNHINSSEVAVVMFCSTLLLCMGMQCAAQQVKSGLESVARSQDSVASSNHAIASAIRMK